MEGKCVIKHFVLDLLFDNTSKRFFISCLLETPNATNGLTENSKVMNCMDKIYGKINNSNDCLRLGRLKFK